MLAFPVFFGRPKHILRSIKFPPRFSRIPKSKPFDSNLFMLMLPPVSSHPAAHWWTPRNPRLLEDDQPDDGDDKVSPIAPDATALH